LPPFAQQPQGGIYHQIAQGCTLRLQSDDGCFNIVDFALKSVVGLLLLGHHVQKD
jgi:hypothetical protein